MTTTTKEALEQIRSYVREQARVADSNSKEWGASGDKVNEAYRNGMWYAYNEILGMLPEMNGHEIISGPGHTPNSDIPPLGDGPRRKMLIAIEVTEDFEKRLDNQWMIEHEIMSDRYKWRWA